MCSKTLDLLHLEAADGFSHANDVINLLPTYLVMTLMRDLTRDHDGP